MPTQIVRDKQDLDQLFTLLAGRKLPLTVTYQNGKHRTHEQNKMQRMWCNEVAEQLGDMTPEEVRGYSKLRLGVPILRAENEEFCEKYDRIIKPLPYEAKLECMMEPLDFPVTRLMTTSQKTRYLDHMLRHWQEQGVRLTIPEEAA